MWESLESDFAKLVSEAERRPEEMCSLITKANALKRRQIELRSLRVTESNQNKETENWIDKITCFNRYYLFLYRRQNIFRYFNFSIFFPLSYHMDFLISEFKIWFSLNPFSLFFVTQITGICLASWILMSFRQTNRNSETYSFFLLPIYIFQDFDAFP